MTEVVSVRFKNKGKVYFFDPAGLDVKSGVSVIVETSKGLEFAECTYGNHEVEDSSVIQPLRPVIRIATEDDIRRAAENKQKESEAFEICQQKIAQHGLDMKLIDVEFNFEGSKILFFFTSDGRVDFRDLVKDLAAVFKTRIELRQIGVRDEARMLGGLGICGRPFCCTQFLDEFHPVSIKMAKTQGLSLNPTKISGTCGRLMCCLKHEQAAYEDIVKKAPKNDAFVKTPSGYGSVASVNLLRGFAKVRLEDGNDTSLKTFTFDELEVLGGKGRLSEYQAAKAEGKLEQAGFEKIEPRQPEIPRILSSFELTPAAERVNAETAPEEPTKSNISRKSQERQQKSEKAERSQSGKNKSQSQHKKQQQDKHPQEAVSENSAGKSVEPAKQERKSKQNQQSRNRRHSQKAVKKESPSTEGVQQKQVQHQSNHDSQNPKEHRQAGVQRRNNYHRRKTNSKKPSGEANKVE